MVYCAYSVFEARASTVSKRAKRVKHIGIDYDINVVELGPTWAPTIKTSPVLSNLARARHPGKIGAATDRKPLVPISKLVCTDVPPISKNFTQVGWAMRVAFCGGVFHESGPNAGRVVGIGRELPCAGVESNVNRAARATEA